MTVDVDEVMRDIEQEVRRARRKRLLAQGAAAEYADPQIYAIVDGVLRRAIEARDHDALLMSELAAGEDSERLTTHLRFASHRSVFGPAVIFAKRRILLPAMRWLYEYSLNNFRRQDRLNRVLFACLEELAIEHAKLQIRIAELQDCRIAESPGGGGGEAHPATELQNGRMAELQDGSSGLPDGGSAGESNQATEE